MHRRLSKLLRPKPVQLVHTGEETVAATWGLNLKAVAAALDAEAEGAADLATQILRQRRPRRVAANPSEIKS